MVILSYIFTKLPGCRMELVSPKGSKIEFFGDFILESAAVFRYYHEIHFHIHFWNQNLRKKIPWHQKNFIFEGRFS